MGEPTAKGPDYGNWVSARLLYIPGAMSILLAGLSLLLPVLAVLAVIFFLCFAYFAYARYRFSPKGGNIQAKVQGLLLDHFEWDGEGKALDIGCGNGPLTIMVGKKYPNARVTGTDNWGGAWEYSKGVCDTNAEIEGVRERVGFQKASAASLPFDDEAFDAAISNLTFHEVRDVKDKRLLIKEALRVVRKGGSFAFQDLFLWKRVYGEVDDLLDMVRGWGIESVELIKTCDSEFIPRALRLPFMLGTIGILRGRK
ncbi:MAG TPA: class I SAM-dependent methyltransferase [Anaerolineae bacterium]|nr:class I SAM-dependent methyltransferase [Anaerolineae bacterium]